MLGTDEKELSAPRVAEYVTACSEYRDRIYRGKVQPKVFFYDLYSTEFESFWAPIFYDDSKAEDSEEKGEDDNED